MDNLPSQPDVIDLFIAYLDGELDGDLTNDITQKLSSDPILNSTVSGLEKLYKEYNYDKKALRTYFKSAKNQIRNKLKMDDL